jgi:hypothetical protein
MAGAPAGRRKPSTNKEADVEETIGYEALLSAEEWEAVQGGDWSAAGEVLDLENIDDSPHPVRVYEAGEAFDVECELCGTVGSSDSEAEAQAIARLHEAFIASLAEKWTLDR